MPQVAVGAIANLTVFDATTEWTFMRSDIRSKARNTPFYWQHNDRQGVGRSITKGSWSRTAYPRRELMGGRLHLGLVYGGCSAEHEVSVVSARSIVSAIDPEQYDLTLIRIDQGGVWRLTGHFGEDTEHGYIPEADSPAQVMALTHGGQLIELDYGKALLRPLDVVFPALHGTNGEDGDHPGLTCAL